MDKQTSFHARACDTMCEVVCCTASSYDNFTCLLPPIRCTQRPSATQTTPTVLRVKWNAGAVRGFGAWTPPTDAAQAVGNTLPLTPPRTVPLPTFVFAICCRAPPLPPLPRTRTALPLPRRMPPGIRRGRAARRALRWSGVG